MKRVAFLAATNLVFLVACDGDRPEANPQQQPATRHPVETADSGPADVGEPDRFILSTHCGIDFAIDFDGSFWRAASEDRRAFRRGKLRALREPSDRGTMTLISENSATYTSNNGPEIHYERAGTTRPDTACF